MPRVWTDRSNKHRQPRDGGLLSTLHVRPINDLIEHKDGECPCGPDIEAVFRNDGSNGWLYIHHSLDGKERNET